MTVTLGPEWATELNAALEVADAHDHTSGKGKPLSLAAIVIDRDLDMLSYAVTSLEAAQFDDLSATLAGASNASSVYVVGGDLYYTNGSGVAVQITAGGSVITTPASLQAIDYLYSATSVSIGAGDDTVTVAMDSTAAVRTVTLPLASAVANGRIYVITDVANASETHNITVSPTGGDTIQKAASYVLNSNGAAIFLQGDGVSNWSII